jgi:hypothetical protein
MSTKEPIFDQREFLLEKSNIRSIPCYVGSPATGMAAAICSKIACIVEPGIQNEQSHTVPDALSTLVISFTTNS